MSVWPCLTAIHCRWRYCECQEGGGLGWGEFCTELHACRWTYRLDHAGQIKFGRPRVSSIHNSRAEQFDRRPYHSISPGRGEREREWVGRRLRAWQRHGSRAYRVGRVWTRRWPIYVNVRQLWTLLATGAFRCVCLEPSRSRFRFKSLQDSRILGTVRGSDFVRNLI